MRGLGLISYSLRPATKKINKKETLAQVFSCEFCEISQNTFSYRAPPVAAPVKTQFRDFLYVSMF